MKKAIVCITVFLFALLSCNRDEQPPKICYEFSDVETLAGFTSCDVTCRNESVDGEGIKALLLLSENENLADAIGFPMQVSGDTLSCSLTDLRRGTLYYYSFEMFTNTENHRIKEIYNFKTLEGDLATVTTFDITDITSTTATGGGNVTLNGNFSITKRGICWSLHHNPHPFIDSHGTSGSGSGWFAVQMTELLPDTTYYVRAYADLSNVIFYGNEVSFKTLSINQPIVNTGQVTNISATSATGSGTVVSEGTSVVTERGICWNTEHNPTIEDSHSSNGEGLGNYSCPITDLIPNQTYYVRAYAISEYGVAYGAEVSFTALDGLPEVTTLNITEITTSSAIGHGKVTDQGGSSVTERGICWSNSHNPTISNDHASSGMGTGEYNVEITGLQANSTYYARAYATNSIGTTYGEEVTFNTLQELTLPTVNTAEVSNIGHISAIGGGNVTDDGGATVTDRGICWSTIHNPTTSDSHASNGSGTGSYTVNMLGLTATTTYYVRAYATNSQGTAYGSEVSFSTLQIPSCTVIVSASPSSGGTVSGGGIYQQGQSCSIQATANNGYTFTNWTEFGTVVSTQANYQFTVYSNRNLVANFQPTAPSGAINGLFTINANGDQVYFSKDNLQYNKTTQVWSFMEHQYDWVETFNQNVGVNYANQNIISLFGWGTSGWDNGNVYYQPYDTQDNGNSSQGYGYGPTDGTSYTYNLTGTYANADWGVRNSISNGGGQTNLWRTLTLDEWIWVLGPNSNANPGTNCRTSSTVNGTPNARFAKAMVHSISGVVVFPDSYIHPSGAAAPENINVLNASFDSNQWWGTAWTAMEDAGCVFLPAAGYRIGALVSLMGSNGIYWSASCNGSDHSYYMSFYDSGLNPQGSNDRFKGFSVRLVQDY